MQCCPTSDGAAAAIIANEAFVRRHGLESQAVEIVGMEMATDLPSTFDDQSCMKLVHTLYFHCLYIFQLSLIIFKIINKFCICIIILKALCTCLLLPHVIRNKTYFIFYNKT